MSRTLVPAPGWTATSFFVASYFFDRPATLRAIQIIGALLWVIYGGLIGARPVMAANALVIVAAAWTTYRNRLRCHGRSPG
jgi:hypothetical protein